MLIFCFKLRPCQCLLVPRLARGTSTKETWSQAAVDSDLRKTSRRSFWLFVVKHRSQKTWLTLIFLILWLPSPPFSWTAGTVFGKKNDGLLYLRSSATSPSTLSKSRRWLSCYTLHMTIMFIWKLYQSCFLAFENWMKSAFVTLPSSFFNFAALFSSRLTLNMALFYDDDDDDDDDDDYDGDLTSYILKISTSCSYEITPFCALSRSWTSSWWSWSSAMIGICKCFSDSFCQIQPGNAQGEAFGRDWILIYVTLSPTMDFDICYQHFCNKWKWINEMPILGWSSGHISI